MTNYLREFQEALEDFLDLTIYFNENEIRYRFQGFWTSSNFEKEIHEKAKKVECLLFRQLKNGKDNRTLLSEIQLRMREVYNFLYDVYYDDFNDLSKSNLKIRYSSALPEDVLLDAFTYDFFEKKPIVYIPTEDLKYEEDEFSMLSNSLSELFERFQMKGTDKPSKLQFENVKLLDCIYCYREILFDLISEVDHFLDNYNKIDFTNIDSISSTIESVGVVEDKYKCHSSLNKLRTAQLFKFLFDERYLFLDKRLEKNETLFKRFLAMNFTFNKNGKQSDIGVINQEFSELKWQHKDIQVDFINELIEKLENRKKVILDFRESKTKKRE